LNRLKYATSSFFARVLLIKSCAEIIKLFGSYITLGLVITCALFFYTHL
jgi:hypothetical protein